MFEAWLRLEARTERLMAVQAGSSSGSAPPGKEEQLKLFRDSLEDLKMIAREFPAANDPWLAEKANHVATGFFGAEAAGPTAGATIASGLVKLARQSPPDLQVRYLEEASEFAGEAPAPAMGVALLWIERRNPARAKAILQAALARTPGDARLLQILGVALAQDQMIDAAIETFGEALANTKDAALRSEIHFNASLAHDLAGHRDEALRECERALQENPKNELARKRLETLRQTSPPGAGGG
jgi:tetratricopeptide (TPR) repeat protein